MSWLHRMQRHVAITRSECVAVVVLAGLFLLGMGVRYAQRVTQTIPEGAYAEVDSLLRLGTARVDTSGVAGVASAGAGMRSTRPQPSRHEPAVARIDLNTATAAELERLPRIGPKLAARIVSYREAHGPFGQIEDLTRVSGIGDKILMQIEPLLYVRLEQ